MIYSNKYSSKILCVSVCLCGYSIEKHGTLILWWKTNDLTDLLTNVAEETLFLQQTKFSNTRFKFSIFLFL